MPIVRMNSAIVVVNLDFVINVENLPPKDNCHYVYVILDIMMVLTVLVYNVHENVSLVITVKTV